MPRPVYLLALLIHLVCPLVFFTDLTRNPYVFQILLLHAGLFFCAGVVAVRAAARGDVRIAPTPLDGPLAVLLAAAAATSAVSWIVHGPFRPAVFSESLRMGLFFLINVVVPFWLAAQLKEGPWEGRFQRAILAVGAVAAGYGVLQYAGYEPVWPSRLNPYNGRPVSTFGNPNFLSTYLVMLMPPAFSRLLAARSAAAASGWTALFLLYASAVICTMTRSSWIGALASGLLFAWLARREIRARPGRAVTAAGVLLALALFWPGSPVSGMRQKPVERLTELARGIVREKSYGSWHQRLMIWSCAWDMARERPLTGKGWGCFELFFPFYQGRYLSDEVYRGFRTHANNAHQLFLEVWSQTGLLGMGLFLWAGWLFWELARRRIPRLPEGRRTASWAGLAGLAGALTDNIFGNVSLFFAVPAFLFSWLWGGLARDLSFQEPRAVSCRAPLARTLAAALSIFCAWGIWRQYAFWRAETAYFAGYKRASRGDAQAAIPFLEASRRFRRFEVNNAYELGNAYLRCGRWALDNGLPTEAGDNFTRALGAYDDALAANAGYDEIHFNRAAVLAQLGRGREAEAEYRLAALINPVNPEVYRALGSLYGNDGVSPGKAAEVYGRAVLYFPRDKEFWNHLGYARVLSGDDAGAEDAFALALALDFDFKGAEDNLRRTLGRTGRAAPPVLSAPGLAADVRRLARDGEWSAARAAAERLRALVPDNAQARLMAADLLAQEGDWPAAERSYRAFLDLEPSHRAGRLNLARTLGSLGRAGEARDLLRDLLREKPDDQDAAALLRSLSGG